MIADTDLPRSREWWDSDPVAAPLVLAIDSSSRTGSLALLRGRAVVAEASWTAHGPGGSLHLDLAARLMGDHGLAASMLHSVVVATGPGSFTGTRAGISVGQGLAEALSIPLIGVPTLEALALQVSSNARTGDVVCTVIGAGRGAVHAWTAVLGRTGLVSCGHAVTATLPEVAAALAAIATTADVRVLVGGELDAGQARVIVSAVPGSVVLSPTATQRRAAWLVELACPALDAIGADRLTGDRERTRRDTGFPEDVQPVYLTPQSGPRPVDLGWRIPPGDQ